MKEVVPKRVHTVRALLHIVQKQKNLHYVKSQAVYLYYVIAYMGVPVKLSFDPAAGHMGVFGL